MFRLAAMPPLALLASCTVPAATAPSEHAQALAFAQERCSGCHAVTAGDTSANPRAPGFEHIANDMGFTQATLREFFRDGHDTPGQMRITLGEAEADLVSTYIMSLQTPRENIPPVVATTCASCHAVRAGGVSPHPQAPAFVDIANMPGLTHDTVVAYLTDAHNYPAQMDVHLDARQIEAIANYLLTLRSADYRRAPS